jgi:hypothetical protein
LGSAYANAAGEQARRTLVEAARPNNQFNSPETGIALAASVNPDRNHLI